MMKKDFLKTDHNQKNIILEVKKSLKNLTENKGFSDYTITNTQFGEAGGYTGEVSEVSIEGLTAEGVKRINLFIKIINSESMVSFLSLSEVFEREFYFYKDIADVFAKLQAEYNVPVEGRYETVKLYDESSSDILILENMSKKGYKICHHANFMQLDYTKIAIKELAKFHSLSLVLKEKNPKYFKNIVTKITHPFDFGDAWEEFVSNMIDIAKEYVNDNYKERLDKYQPEITKHYTRTSCLEGEKNLVLCHGDFRNDNLLCKVANNKIFKIIPIDFQLIYYGCPAMDFLYFVYGSTDRIFRREHLNDLKNVYYDTLNSFLKYFDINVENIMTKAEFENMFNARLEYGLLASLLLSCLLTKTNVGSSDEEKYKNKMLDVLEDLVEFGFL